MHTSELGLLRFTGGRDPAAPSLYSDPKRWLQAPDQHGAGPGSLMGPGPENDTQHRTAREQLGFYTVQWRFVRVVSNLAASGDLGTGCGQLRVIAPPAGSGPTQRLCCLSHPRRRCPRVPAGLRHAFLTPFSLNQLVSLTRFSRYALVLFQCSQKVWSFQNRCSCLCGLMAGADLHGNARLCANPGHYPRPPLALPWGPPYPSVSEFS